MKLIDIQGVNITVELSGTDVLALVDAIGEPTKEESALTVELDPTDCQALADACAWRMNHDIAGDCNLLAAPQAALTSGAMAAFALDRAWRRSATTRYASGARSGHRLTCTRCHRAGW